MSVLHCGWFINAVDLLNNLWGWASSRNLFKTDLVVQRIEQNFILLEEVETEDPVYFFLWVRHELDSAHVIISLKPLGDWNCVCVWVNFEMDILSFGLIRIIACEMLQLLIRFEWFLKLAHDSLEIMNWNQIEWGTSIKECFCCFWESRNSTITVCCRT